MGIKRKLSEIDFSIDLFIKKFQDPETTFVSLSEFNENANENEDLIEILLKTAPNFEISHLLTEVKRKSSENITLYRFLTHLLAYFTQTNQIHHSERLIQQFSSFSTIYFLLSSNSTANHLKIILKLLISISETSEFAAKWLFSSLDLKKPCWKLLLRRRDVRDPENVRFSTIKFIFSAFFYENSELNRRILQELDVFHEIFSGLPKDSTENIEFILENLKNHVILSNSITKSDKIRLFNDKNLKFLIKLYQNDEKTRKNVHNLLTIVLNSKNYGICFFDPGFRPNSNQIIGKLVVFLLNQVENDEFLANLVVNCLRTCPDLLSSVWKTISNEFGLKNEKFVEFLTEILQQQKKLSEWKEIWMSFGDSSKLIDVLVQLTIPMEVLAKFEWKKTTIRFLAEVVERIMQALDVLQQLPLACEKELAIQGYQQAILRVRERVLKRNESIEILEVKKNIFHIFSL